MIHARLAIAAENSGKLVSQVRNEARKVAQNCGAQLLLSMGHRVSAAQLPPR